MAITGTSARVVMTEPMPGLMVRRHSVVFESHNFTLPSEEPVMTFDELSFVNNAQLTYEVCPLSIKSILVKLFFMDKIYSYLNSFKVLPLFKP